MNIKGIARNLMPTEVSKAKAPTKELKSETSTERDGNGQQQQQEPERRKLTDEELKAAIEHLEQLPGVKSNHLVVKLHTETEYRVVTIEDPSGKIVRRIPEMDLLQILKHPKKEKGQIFDRAM